MKKYLSFIIIFMLILFYFCSNYIFLKQGVDYTGIDVDMHLVNKLEFYNKVNQVLSGNFPARERLSQFFLALNRTRIWPPMVYFFSYLINVIFGNSTFVTELSNILYVAILITGIYLLGKKISGQNTGLLAAFIVFSFPAVSILSRKYGLDLPMMAWEPWLIISLLNTKRFTDMKRSILFGLFLGLVILFKLQILIFLLGPMLYVLFVYPDIHNTHFKVPKPLQIVNLAFSLGSAAFISSVWWGKNLISFLSTFLPQFYSIEHRVRYGCATGFSLEGFYFYADALQIGVFYSILFTLALLHYSLLRNKGRYIRNMLFVWIIVPYLFFIFMLLCWRQHWIFPLLPSIALFIAFEIEQLANKKVKKYLIVLVLLLGITGLVQSNLSQANQMSRLINISIDYDKEARYLIKQMRKILPSYSIRLTFLSMDLMDNVRYKPAFIYSCEETTLERIYKYNMLSINDPEIHIGFSRCNSNNLDSFDFIILQRASPKKILERVYFMNMLEEKKLPKEEFARIFNIKQIIIKEHLKYLKELPEIQKAIEWIKSHKYSESYFFSPLVRLHYIFKIKKEKMTITQCAQLLNLPDSEIASWVDDYEQNGIVEVISKYENSNIPSDNAFMQYYEKEEQKRMGQILRYFTIVETRELPYKSSTYVSLLKRIN